MKIIVCVKQICHTYARTGQNPERHFLEPTDKIYRINPHDEMALELALRLKDSHDDTKIILLTLGPLIAEHELRRCLAMGADHLYGIKCIGRLDPWEKSAVLAKSIRQLAADMVLCGKESLDSQNGQVGAFLAHRLKVPLVSAITVLQILEGGSAAEVQRRCGRGTREVIQCPLPAVFTVERGPAVPRFPTHAAYQSALAYPIQEFTFADEKTLPRLIPKNTYPPRPRPRKVPAPDSAQEAYYRIEQLLTTSRVEKKGTVLTGSPENQVEGILAFLEKHGFLEAKKQTGNE